MRSLISSRPRATKPTGFMATTTRSGRLDATCFRAADGEARVLHLLGLVAFCRIH